MERGDSADDVTTPKMMRIPRLMKTKDGFGKQASVQLNNSPNVMLLNCKEKKEINAILQAKTKAKKQV